MNATFETVTLTSDHLKSYSDNHKIIAVRLFLTPHYWYAGLLDYYVLENEVLELFLQKTIRFERNLLKDVWLPGQSLVNAQSDQPKPDSKNEGQKFSLKEPECIVHRIFADGEGVIGIRHVEGFTHLSYRGADVLSVQALLQRK
jgi:hypothetical protein